jgi:hypothetical protein
LLINAHVTLHFLEGKAFGLRVEEDGLAVINALETAVKSSTARAEMPFNQVKW